MTLNKLHNFNDIKEFIMSLTLDAKEARKADGNGAIRETGKYTGFITRAEKITASTGTIGLGLSFAADDESTANYLDTYFSSNIHAILACTKTKQAEEGNITFEAYDKEAKALVKKTAIGYPALMGKRIGLLLQRELSVYQGKNQDRVTIAGIFEADTDFTASEILDRKTEPVQLAKMYANLMLTPVKGSHDNSSNQTRQQAPASAGGNFDDFEDNIPFMNPYKFNWRMV
jgi:hypothetical protein